MNGEKQTMSNLIESKAREMEAVTKKLENCEKEKEELGIEIGKQKRKVDGLQALLRASELKSEKLNRFLDRLRCKHVLTAVYQCIDVFHYIILTHFLHVNHVKHFNNFFKRRTNKTPRLILRQFNFKTCLKKCLRSKCFWIFQTILYHIFGFELRSSLETL